MITVHHLNQSRSQRVLWLLEELGEPYEIVRHERDPKTMLAPPELKKIHPLGKSPVIVDGDVVLAESAAILEYLLEKKGTHNLRPAAGTPQGRSYLYWMHYAEGSAMSPLLLSLIFHRIPKQPMPFFVKPIAKAICQNVLRAFVQPQIKLHLDFMESHLQSSLWFAGESLTAADIQMSFPVEAAAVRGDFKGQYPRLQAYLDRIHSRPAYQRAIEKGGPFEILT